MLSAATGKHFNVNNAGIYPERPLFEETPAFFDELMAINVRGVHPGARGRTRDERHWRGGDGMHGVHVRAASH